MEEEQDLPMPPKDWMVRNIALVLERESGTPAQIAERLDLHLRGNWAMCCMAQAMEEGAPT